MMSMIMLMIFRQKNILIIFSILLFSAISWGQDIYNFSSTSLEKLQKELNELLVKYTDQHPDVIALKKAITEAKQQKQSKNNHQASVIKTESSSPQVKALKAKLNELLTTLTERHPDVVALKQEINELEQSMQPPAMRRKQIKCTINYRLDESEMAVDYHNPIIDRYLADPFILRAHEQYYLFATGSAKDGRYLPIYRSADLVNWEFVRGAVARGDSWGAWNRKNFWAPEVIEIKGRFYLYYTASTEGTPKNTGNRVGLAVSDDPEGPYEDVGVVVPYASLDGSPFLDADGMLYLYYATEHGNRAGFHAGRIYVDKLVSPDQVSGNPVLIAGHYNWQEAPSVVLRNGQYYLTYSTGGWRTANYSVRWAVGSSPEGPFEEQPFRLLKSTAAVKGPGHLSIFTDYSGHDWIVYHAWDTRFTARYPRIDPLLVSTNSLLTIGPTVTPQSIGPSFWQATVKPADNLVLADQIDHYVCAEIHR